MSTPRKHHYVPRFYLKNFTRDFSVDGRLWVVDLENRKAWPSTPAKAAFETDFYRGELAPNIDPMWLERGFAEDVEPLMAQVLAFVLDTKEIPPCGAAHDIFLNLVATSLVRGRSMRARNSSLFDESIKRFLREHRSSQDDDVVLQELMKDSDLSFNELLSVNDEGGFQYDFDRITHLKAMMAQVTLALNILSRRNWTARLVADDVPDLVCSDAPVGIVPLAKEVPMIWLDPKALVVMPLSRRVAAIGSLVDIQGDCAILGNLI